MTTAKAHRYLVSYQQAGLVVQSERSGTYDLGPLAVRLGLAAIARFDIVRLAMERLGELRDAVNATSLMSLWTDDGPAVCAIELSRQPVTLAVRVGTTFPLISSATGRIFLAFGHHRQSPRAAAQIAEAGLSAVDDVVAQVRAAGVAIVDQTFLIGVQALAVPLLHADGRLAAAVTVIGSPGTFDLREHGAIATGLRAFVSSLRPG